MGKLIDPVIIRGTVSGRCPKCSMSYSGELTTDGDGFQDVELNCNGCGHSGKYYYRWPDELPKVTLRHRSNNRVLGDRKSRKKKKKKKINPLVLPGQLSFDECGPGGVGILEVEEYLC